MKKRKIWMMVTAGFLGCYLCLMGILTLFTREQYVQMAENQIEKMNSQMSGAVQRAAVREKAGDSEFIRQQRLNTQLNSYRELVENLQYSGLSTQRSALGIFTMDGSLYAGGTTFFCMVNPEELSEYQVFREYADENGGGGWGAAIPESPGVSLLDYTDPVAAGDFDEEFWEGLFPWMEKFYLAGEKEGFTYKNYTGKGVFRKYRYRDTDYVVLKELSVIEEEWKIMEEGERVEDYPNYREDVVYEDGSVVTHWNTSVSYAPDGTVTESVLVEENEVYRWENPREYEGTLVMEAEDESLLYNLSSKFYYPYYITTQLEYPFQMGEGWKEWVQDSFLMGEELQLQLKEEPGENKNEAGNYWESSWYTPEIRRSGFFKVQSYRAVPTTYGSQPLVLYAAVSFEPVKEAMRSLRTVYGYSFLVTVVSGILVGMVFLKLEEKKARFEKNRRDLTNSMAHEMKTPLAVIRNLSENAKEESREEKRRYYLDGVIAKTEEMDGLVKRIVTISELHADEKALHEENLDLEALVLSELEKFENRIEGKNLEVTRETRQIFRYANEKMMAQVFYNLISNAVSYTPMDGHIRIRLTEEAFSIENTGSCLPEEEKEKIWEVFYHNSGDTGGEESHMGLGLYLVRQITGRYGMKCIGENTPAGVRFTIFFRKKS